MAVPCMTRNTNLCCTGTRIRTQTEGFGDLCTTVILYPYNCFKKAAQYTKNQTFLKNKVPGPTPMVLCF
jgi:hypothetical protein